MKWKTHNYRFLLNSHINIYFLKIASGTTEIEKRCLWTYLLEFNYVKEFVNFKISHL